MKFLAFKRIPPFFILLIFALGLGLIYLSYNQGTSFIQNQTKYRLKKVKIYGLKVGKADEIIKKIGLNKDSNLILLNEQKIKKKLESIPRVSQAEIKVNLPDTVVIRLEEREPGFLIKANQDFGSITLDGEIVAEKKSVNSYNHLVLVAEGMPSLAHALKSDSVRKFITFYKELSPEEKKIKDIFSDVVFANGITFHSKKKRLSIYLGNKLTLEKLRKAYYAYVYHEDKRLNYTYIDVSGRLVRFNNKI